MEIKNIIREEMHKALKNHDNLQKKIYSLALDVILKEEKNKKQELSNDEVIVLLQKEIKQYKETKEYAEKTNSDTIIQECDMAINLLNTFIPQQMSLEEIQKYVINIMNKQQLEKNIKNKGVLMKSCSSLKGKANMSDVSKIVDSILK